MGRVARAIEGRVARAVERRIHARADRVFQDPAARAGWERHQRAMDHLADVAEDVASRGMTDSEAHDRVAAQLLADREVIDQTIAHLASQRTSYLMDRAFRLPTAARDHDEVRPIDPRVRDQFLAQARIGRLPLEEAFCRASPARNPGSLSRLPAPRSPMRSSTGYERQASSAPEPQIPCSLRRLRRVDRGDEASAGLTLI